MPKSPRSRRRLAAALTAAILPVLASGCAASYGAETVKPYIPADGVWGNSGHVKARNVLLVADEQGSGAGTLVASLLTERGTDRLTGITVAGSDVTMQPNQVQLSENVVNFGREGKPATETTSAEAFAENDAVRPGRMVKITFSFANAAPLSLQALVVERTETYSSVPEPPGSGAQTGGPTTGPVSGEDEDATPGPGEPTEGEQPGGEQPGGEPTEGEQPGGEPSGAVKGPTNGAD